MLRKDLKMTIEDNMEKINMYSSQETEQSRICVRGIKPGNRAVVTALFPGLIPLTHIHDCSVSWLDTLNTYT
jgi:hypothetical protein